MSKDKTDESHYYKRRAVLEKVNDRGNEIEEKTRDKAYNMIEEGYLRSEICTRLGISVANYWKIKKDWDERRRRRRDDKLEFRRFRGSISESCKRLLIRLTGPLAQYSKKGTIEELERMLEELPSVKEKEVLEGYMEILNELKKEIADMEFSALKDMKKKEKEKFQVELKKAEAKKLIALYKDATRHGLSREETIKREQRIRLLYSAKK
jgi:hypothetical protein